MTYVGASKYFSTVLKKQPLVLALYKSEMPLIMVLIRSLKVLNLTMKPAENLCVVHSVFILAMYWLILWYLVLLQYHLIFDLHWVLDFCCCYYYESFSCGHLSDIFGFFLSLTLIFLVVSLILSALYKPQLFSPVSCLETAFW